MTLALCLMARNEERGAPATLDSVRGLVDEIVIAIDPTTTDNTKEAVEKWLTEWDPSGEKWKVVEGAVLEEVGFGPARNVALEHVKSEWVLILDADERFPEHEVITVMGPDQKPAQRICRSHDELRALLANLEPEVGMVALRLYMFEDDGTLLSDFQGERLIRKECRFAGGMHNYVVGYDKARGVDIAIIHNRKYRSKADRAFRAEQRLRMAEKFFLPAVELDPEDSRSMFYLAGTYNDAGRREQAIEWYERYLTSPKTWPHERYQAAVFLSRAYMERGRGGDERKEDAARARTLACTYLKDNWQRAELYHTLGQIAEEAGDFDQAIHWYFLASTRPPKLDPHFVEAATHSWLPRLSLARCYFAKGEVPKAEEWLAKAREAGAPEKALDVVYRFALPQYRPLKRMAVFIDRGDDKFIAPLIDRWQEEFEVLVCRGKSDDDAYNKQMVREGLEWAKDGAAWFEWAGPLLIDATRNHPHECRVITRVHGYEAHSDYFRQINWSRVDNVIFVAEYLRQIAYVQAPEMRRFCATHVVPGGVVADRYVVAEGKQGNKIAMAGYINPKKNFPLALQIFWAARKLRPELELHICGTWQDSRLLLYMRNWLRDTGLESAVKFEEWQTDLNAWFADKDYYLSTSVEESLHYSLAQGMAAGLKPIVHSWESSGDFYPQECIFRTVDEAVAMLQEKATAEDRAEYRKWVVENLSFDNQAREMDLILARPTVGVPAPDAAPWRFEMAIADVLAGMGFSPALPTQADLVIACGGSLRVLDQPLKPGQKRLIWYAEQVAGDDDHGKDRRERIKPYLDKADMIVVSSPHAKPILEEMGAKDVRVLYQGGARLAWAKTQEKPKAIDVSFCGVITPRRRKFLDELNAELEALGLVKVHEFQSYDHAALADLTHRSKIALNIHATDELNVETRVGEVLAAGTFLLTEALPLHWASERYPVVEFVGADMAARWIQQYLVDDTGREKIADEACKWVWENMTVGHQVHRLLEMAGCRWATDWKKIWEARDQTQGVENAG